MPLQRIMDKWRYVCMVSGDQYVLIDGTTGMLRLCVDNWDTMEVGEPNTIAVNHFH